MNKTRIELSKTEEIRSSFDYDPATGRMVSQRGRSPRDGGRGYPVFTFNDMPICVHRLAWVHYYGHDTAPGMEIDHIDGNRWNNAITNLREVTTSVNRRNGTNQLNQYGFVGVMKNGDNYISRIKLRVNGKVKSYLGKSRTSPADAYLDRFKHIVDFDLTEQYAREIAEYVPKAIAEVNKEI